MAAGGAPSSSSEHPAVTAEAHAARMRDIEFRIKEAELQKIVAETDRLRGSQNSSPRSTTLQGERTPSFVASPAVLAAKPRFPGINLVQLERIYTGAFEPSNLSKLRRVGGVVEDTHSQTISFEGGTLRSEPTKGKNRDFGNNSDIWEEGFISYASAVWFFSHDSSLPSLGPAILGFYLRIKKLGRIYKWQEAVLLVALEHHNEVMTKGQTNAEAWDVSESLVAYFCNDETKRTLTPPLPRALPARSSKRPRADTKPPFSDEICNLWNAGVCGKGGACSRRHVCSGCAGDHPEKSCRIKKNP